MVPSSGGIWKYQYYYKYQHTGVTIQTAVKSVKVYRNSILAKIWCITTQFNFNQNRNTEEMLHLYKYNQ